MTLYLEKDWLMSAEPVPVYDEYQQLVYLVAVKGASLRQRIKVLDAAGHVVLAQVKPGMSLFRTRKLLYDQSKRIATVSQRLTSRNRVVYEVSGLKWRIKEDFGQRHYQMTDRADRLIAEIEKCWMFRAERFAVTLCCEDIDPVRVLAAFLAVDLSSAKNELYQVAWDAPYSLE